MPEAGLVAGVSGQQCDAPCCAVRRAGAFLDLRDREQIGRRNAACERDHSLGRQDAAHGVAPARSRHSSADAAIPSSTGAAGRTRWARGGLVSGREGKEHRLQAEDPFEQHRRRTFPAADPHREAARGRDTPSAARDLRRRWRGGLRRSRTQVPRRVAPRPAPRRPAASGARRALRSTRAPPPAPAPGRAGTSRERAQPVE